MMDPESSPASQPDTNADPLSGEPGAHPVATGLGAAAIGAAGVAIATAVAGPIGVAAAVLGAPLIGGYVGKAAGEVIDPTAEEAYWREQHPRQPYAADSSSYEEFQPAYQAGYEGFGLFRTVGSSFDDIEAQVRSGYEKSGATLPWTRAREASRAAWARIQERQLHSGQDAPGSDAPTTLPIEEPPSPRSASV